MHLTGPDIRLSFQYSSLIQIVQLHYREWSTGGNLVKSSLLVSIGRSVSDDETLVASGLSVLVSDETVASLCHGLALDVEERAQVLVNLHLIAVVFSVILDVPLVCTQVFHNIFLLAQLWNKFQISS